MRLSSLLNGVDKDINVPIDDLITLRGDILTKRIDFRLKEADPL